MYRTPDKALNSVEIRVVSAADAVAVAQLSGELGYATSAEAMIQRIQEVCASEERAVFVACLNAQVVGWIEVGVSCHLQSAPYALISGLVVSEQVRSRGIGKLLCARAETWARQRGLAILRVRSQVARQDAHRFYHREGFRQTKVSAVFEKRLDAKKPEPAAPSVSPVSAS